MGIITRGIGYLERGLNVYLPVVFGESSEVLGKAYKSNLGYLKNAKIGRSVVDSFNVGLKDRTIIESGKQVIKKGSIGSAIKEAWKTVKDAGVKFGKNFWKGTKEAGKAAEKFTKESGGSKAVLKNLRKSITDFPKVFKEGWKAGGEAAKAAGKIGFFGKLKGAFKNVGKKLPGIGSLLILAFEAPNIIKATKEKGLWQGVKETGKAAARLGGFTLGSAIGSAICPGVGTIIGGLLGDWITGKIVGKSYSEKKAEEERLVQERAAQIEENIMQQVQPQQYPQGLQGQYAQAQAATNPFAQTSDTNLLAQYQKNLYGANNALNDDFMSQAFGIQKPMYQSQYGLDYLS